MSRHSATGSVIRQVLAGTALAAASGAIAVHAQEQAPAAGEQSLQTVVVTGSMIKRTDFETPSPVQVLSSEDLQQSGYTSVQQVLSNLAANGQGTLSQGFSGAFAAGASGIALRGLTVGATLTLIDGQRMVAYPLTDDGQRSFVDTASIPLVAVDRIDVLKDGASAEYGSDAMAGVVNVVLRKSYVGAELTADAGTTIHRDGSTQRLSGIFGVGDLATDGYNAYLAIEWRHQDEIWNYNRTGQPWNQLDWTAQGGTNATQGAGSLWANYGFGTSFPNASGYYLAPASATSFQSPGVMFPTSACASATALAADECTFTQKGFQIQPQTGNLNIIGRFTKNLAGEWQAIVTASTFHSEAEQIGLYQTMDPAGPGAPIQFPAYGPGFLGVTNPITLQVPCGNPMNPQTNTCQTMYPVGNLFEFGPSADEIATTTDRVFLDFKGAELGWDLDASLGWMYARTDQTISGLVNYQTLQTALDKGYVFGTGGPAAAGISVPINNEMSNSMQLVSLNGTRSLMTLPGGPLSLGLGLGYNHRYLDAVPSELTQAGDFQIINATYAYGGQTNYNAYGEIVAPLLKGLEVDIAQRYDHYNNVGGASVPKFGVKYSPVRQITFRGTYGKGFRAPNPAEYGHAASAFLLGQYADNLLCPSANTPANAYIPAYNLSYPVPPAAGDVAAFCNFPAVFVQGTNPALLPERSTNYTYGAIFQPVDQVSLSVDWWDIKVTNLIVTPSEFPALPFPPQPVLNARTGPVTLPQLQADGSTALKTFPEGEPIYSLVSYENAGEIHVSGLDVDFETHFDIGKLGRISGSLNWSHEFLWDMSSCYGGQCATVYLAGTHGPTGISGDTGNPKDRAVLTVSWDKDSWDMTWTVNYTGHYSLLDPSTEITDCGSAIANSFNAAAKFANGFVPEQYCNVSHFTNVNLYLSYAFSDRFAVTGSVVNVFNAQPPVDMQTYGNSLLAYNPSLAQDGAIGTFFNLGVRYKF